MKRMTNAEHAETGRALLAARRELWRLVRGTLSRRAPAPVLDAALKAERQLFALSLRLCDSLTDGHTLYPLDLASGDVAVPYGRPKRLTPDEHRRVGAGLCRLQAEVMSLGVRVGNAWPKGSPVGRAAFGPDRAVGRLRSMLDDLFCKQHPAAFDARAYYPGHTLPDEPPTSPHVASDAVTPPVSPSPAPAPCSATCAPSEPPHLFTKESRS